MLLPCAHVSRVFIAETAGVDLDASTAESFAAHIDAIDDAGSYTIRGGPART